MQSTRMAAWYDGIGDDELYLSVIVIGEIRQGIERVRKRDPRHAIVLENWLSEVIQTFDARILPIDRAVADAWGRLIAIGTFPVVDALLAATAQAHGLTLVTRNIKDLSGTGVNYLNPFDFGA